MPKKLKARVIVSIPRAGEFIATLNLDAEDIERRVARGDKVTEAVTSAAFTEVMSRYVVKLVPGQTRRLKKALEG